MTRINEMTDRPATRSSRPGSVAAVLGALVIIAGAPAGLLAASSARFGHLSPLHGMNAPWRWTMADVRSWGRTLTGGIDTSAELVDLFLRIVIVAAWVCVAVLVYTIVAAAGAISYPEARFHVVRVGIAMYGVHPAPGVGDVFGYLRPAAGVAFPGRGCASGSRPANGCPTACGTSWPKRRRS